MGQNNARPKSSTNQAHIALCVPARACFGWISNPDFQTVNAIVSITTSPAGANARRVALCEPAQSVLPRYNWCLPMQYSSIRRASVTNARYRPDPCAVASKSRHRSALGDRWVLHSNKRAALEWAASGPVSVLASDRACFPGPCRRVIGAGPAPETTTRSTPHAHRHPTPTRHRAGAISDRGSPNLDDDTPTVSLSPVCRHQRNACLDADRLVACASASR